MNVCFISLQPEKLQSLHCDDYDDDDMFLLKGAEVINITFCAHLIEMP